MTAAMGVFLLMLLLLFVDLASVGMYIMSRGWGVGGGGGGGWGVGRLGFLDRVTPPGAPVLLRSEAGKVQTPKITDTLFITHTHT